MTTPITIRRRIKPPRRNTIVLLAISLTCFTAGRASAANYYVSLSGRNSNSGGLSSPWRTITYAVTKVRAGDTIRVAPGNYGKELVRISTNGTATSPISLTRSGSTGEVILTSSGMADTAISLAGSYWNIEHFRFKNYGTGLLLQKTAHHNSIRNCVAEGTGASQNGGVEYRGFLFLGDHNAIEDCRAAKIGGACSTQVGKCGTGLRLEGDYNSALGFQATDCGHFGISIDNTEAEPATGNLVDGGTFSNNGDTAIAVADAADTVIQNVTVDRGDSGLRAYASASNTTISGCIIKDVNRYAIRLLSDTSVSDTTISGSCNDGVCIGCESNLDTSDLQIFTNRLRVECDYHEYRFLRLINGSTNTRIVLQNPVNSRYRIRMDRNTGCGSPEVKYTNGRVFREDGGRRFAIYWPSHSEMLFPCSGSSSSDVKFGVTAFNMAAVPSSGSATVSVSRFGLNQPLGQTLVEFDAQSQRGNSVKFSVWGLPPGHSYLIEREGRAFLTQRSDSAGFVRFSNAQWQSSPTTFTMKEVVSHTDAYFETDADDGETDAVIETEAGLVETGSGDVETDTGNGAGISESDETAEAQLYAEGGGIGCGAAGASRFTLAVPALIVALGWLGRRRKPTSKETARG